MAYSTCAFEVVLLSVKNCRELLGDGSPFTDEEIEEMRAQLYSIAHVVIDRFGAVAVDATSTGQTQGETAN